MEGGGDILAGRVSVLKWVVMVAIAFLSSSMVMAILVWSFPSKSKGCTMNFGSGTSSQLQMVSWLMWSRSYAAWDMWTTEKPSARVGVK